MRKESGLLDSHKKGAGMSFFFSFKEPSENRSDNAQRQIDIKGEGESHWD